MKERDEFLEKEFDFSRAVKNPYAKSLKKTITINLDETSSDILNKNLIM